MSVDAHTPITTSQRLNQPLNGTIYQTQRVVASEKPLPTIGQTMEAELGQAWADSIVIGVSNAPDSSKKGLVITHARIPSEADQLATNWERQLINVGIGQMEGVVRTVILPASSYQDNSPALNSDMPTTGGMFAGHGYVLFARDAVLSGSQLEPVFRVERRTFIRKSAQTQIDFDAEFGGVLRTVQTLYYRIDVITGGTNAAALFAAPANAYWGLQSTGYSNEGQQLTPDWYVITNRQVVPSAFVSGGRTYTTVENYFWPAVLLGTGYALDQWQRNEGGSDMYVRPIFSKDAYRGPCKATITETFHTSPPTVTPPNVMLPMPIDLATPFFSLNIEPCLHAAIDIPITSGTDHPIYEYTGGTYTYEATSPTDWPASIVAADDVRPFRGGYLRSQVTIFQPSYTAPPP